MSKVLNSSKAFDTGVFIFDVREEGREGKETPTCMGQLYAGDATPNVASPVGDLPSIASDIWLGKKHVKRR